MELLVSYTHDAKTADLYIRVYMKEFYDGTRRATRIFLKMHASFQKKH